MAKRQATIVGVDPVISEARERWDRCAEAEEAQRVRILAAKKFRAGDQWDPDIKSARQGKIALQGVGAQPPRPCLTIDRLSQPCRQVSNQIKSANFAIDVAPVGHGADDETAEIFKGYLRRMQNQARGESPIEWAADGAIEGGLGWFRLRADFVEESPDQPGIEVFDQELRLERITNNLTVYCDPSANRPTRSDALYMFVTEDLSKEEFKRRWPDADVKGLEDFAATGDNMRDWVTKDDIRIAEYWRVIFVDEAWAMLPDGSVKQFADEASIPKIAKAKRIVRRPKVEGYKISATEILERWDWTGSRIPLIPVLGEELNVDGQIVLRGIVSEGMDAQRMLNYAYSGMIETYALAPKAPFIAAAGQIDMYKEFWQQANTANFSYLPYDPIELAGSAVPPPQRQQAEPPIQAAAEIMRVSEDAIKATTGIFDASLGNMTTKDRSGKAITALQGQSELGTSNYSDGVMRALVYAGELAVEILPKITRPGQILHLLGMDDEPQQVIAGQRFVMQDGKPQPFNPQDPAMAAIKEGEIQFFDLTKGKYAVTVIVGKGEPTKREEAAAILGELIGHLPPEMAMVATPDYVEQLDFDGSHAMAEKLRKALPPQLQAQEDDGSIPPQAKQMIQQLQMELQKAQQIIATDGAKEQVKQQGAMQEAQMRSQTELQKAQLDRQTRLDIAQIQANAGVAEADIKAGNADLDRRLKLIELFLTADKERRLDAESKMHDAGLTGLEHAHDHALSAQEHQQTLAQNAQEHSQTMQQQAQAAALAPEPASNGNGASA